jgi:nucleotide-binding universal stress UspA family protein
MITLSGIASILVCLQAQESFSETGALSFAIALARSYKAALSLYAFAPQLGRISDRATVPEIVSTATAKLESECGSTVRNAARLICDAGLDVTAETAHSARERKDTRLLQLGRVNDVTVLDAAHGHGSAARINIEDALFETGRPVLVIPPAKTQLLPRHVAVAWDGSSRAARAVKDALPFLSAAQRVSVVTVTGEKDLSRMAPGADLATYLIRHRIDCRFETLAAVRGDVGRTLRNFITEEAVEMLVMGAFVHTRLREAILGGVTRSLLDRSPVPLMLSH